jgi:signal transduction histidine kinase
VLTPACRHYGQELRMVAVSSRRLVEKMMALNARLTPSSERGKKSTQHWEIAPAAPVENLAAELQANRNLLAALAGAAVTLTVEVQGGALPVSLTGEELTRVLVNLVKNAADAMPTGGRIHLELREAGSDLQLMVEDSGPGIAPEALESIFLSGYSTRLENDSWTESHRGLGLAITRSIVEASGGSITVSNRSEGGARFVLRLPVREG